MKSKSYKLNGTLVIALDHSGSMGTLTDKNDDWSHDPEEMPNRRWEKVVKGAKMVIAKMKEIHI